MPQKQPNLPEKSYDDLELTILVNAKKAGLSFLELNELRVKDYVEFMNIYTGEAEHRPKQATQSDIDRLLG